MKSPHSLLPHLAPFLARAAVSQAGPSLLDACDELSIDHNGGVLSGRCHGAAGDPMLTSVDLDRCLGWGPRDAHLGLRGRTSGLGPVKDGAFTDYCSPCYIVTKDESNQGAAHLLCGCGPNDSDTSLEYFFDLGSLVIVTGEGCLECMGTTGGCVREAPSWSSPDLSSESDLGGGLVGLPELEDKRVPCEGAVTDYEDLLPATYPNTTHNRCRQDHALCCYQTPARHSRLNTYFEAFKFIRGRNCIYRLHYVIDWISLEITGQLSHIVQFCDPIQSEILGEGCEGETQIDEVPGLPEDDTGLNVLEDSEQIVYGDDSSEHEPELTQVADPWISTTIENSGRATALLNDSKTSSSRAPVGDPGHVVAAAPRQ